jgi:hypothetical protein
MIAAVLGVTVDRTAKDKLLRDVSADIWHHLMGRDLPLEIKAFIKDSLLDTKVVCTRYEVRYRLAQREDGRLDVHVVLRRDLENFGRQEDVLNNVHIGIPLDDTPTIHGVTCEKDGQPPRSSLELSNGDGIIMLAKFGDLTLAPHGKAGSKAAFTWTYSLISNRSDTGIHAYSSPSLGAAIFLDHPVPMGITFVVDDADKVSDTHWRRSGVIWGGQYIRVRWRDKSLKA